MACGDRYLLLQIMVTFTYGGVMNLCLVCSSQSYSVEDQSHHVWVEAGSNQVQYICHNVIPSFLVLQLEVEPRKGSNPSMASGIKVRCCHYVG